MELTPVAQHERNDFCFLENVSAKFSTSPCKYEQDSNCNDSVLNDESEAVPGTALISTKKLENYEGMKKSIKPYRRVNLINFLQNC